MFFRAPHLLGGDIVEILNKNSGMSPSALYNDVRSKFGYETIQGMSIISAVVALHKAGLIEIWKDGIITEFSSDRMDLYSLMHHWQRRLWKDEWPLEDENFIMRASQKWVEIKMISNTDFHSMNERLSPRISCSPLFTEIGIATQAGAFVIMPFSEKYNRIYRFIRSAVEQSGMSCIRADEFTAASPIIDKIFSGIKNCRFVIADCTERNPNVFYELGIAHTMGKPCILLIGDNDEMPFDVRHIEYIRYDRNHGLRILKHKLSKIISGNIERKTFHPKKNGNS